MRVIVAIDGSRGSEQAAEAVKQLAPAQELTLLYAADVPRLSYPATTPGLQKDFSLQVESAMREEGQQILDRIASSLGTDAGPIRKKIEVGNAADVILGEIEASRADLIVLGSRGLGSVSEVLLGSVSHRVATHAPCSTLIVKSAMANLRRVLMPVESRRDAEGAVAFLANKPFRNPVDVTVLHVLPFDQPAWPAGAILPESLRSEMLVGAERVAQEIATELPSPSYRATAKVRVGMPPAVILEEAEALHADLILMPSRIRPAISRFFLGSVSHAVVHKGNFSVYLLR